MTTIEREKLILDYMPLANKLAWDRTRVTPASVTFDDLKSAAYMGLVDAANKYDSSRGTPFGPYARIRISGEITDYLREIWSRETSCEEVIETIPDVYTVNYDELLEDVTKSLTAIGQKLVRMYYVEGLTMREIGESEGITESRVSQILKDCRGKMRDDCERSYATSI
jgi:RNA polymerase sigma factor (sigma-70 family)